MPSILHEAMIRLLRNRPQLAPELLKSVFSAKLPRYTDVRIDSADLAEVQPAEYRADLVVLLSDIKPVFGLVVEVQLSIDDSKRFVWPAYVTNLRARWRCPVCLFVICMDTKVARWAEIPTHIGCTNVFIPRVLPIGCVPEIMDDADAAENPELAVLSAVIYGKNPDVAKAARIAAVALRVSAKLDADRSSFYFDFVLSSLSEAAREVLQQNMRPDGYEYQSDFARKYVTEGRAEMLTQLLNARFGPLSEEVKARIASSSYDEVRAIGNRVLTAASLEEALAPRS